MRIFLFLCKLSTLKSNECDRNVLQPRLCNANACFIVQAAAVPEIPDPEMETLESWGKSSLSLLSRNTFLMNIFHYFLPIFRLHRNMQVCLTCMYGRDTCFLAGKVAGIRLRVWDSWDSLERWWQKYSYATYNLKKLIFFFFRKMKKST